MRKFHQMIFMGNGEHSQRKCELLVARVWQGLSTLSGIQQNRPENGCSKQDFKAHQEEMDDELQEIIKDIAAAYGREVRIGRRLPYPNKRARKAFVKRLSRCAG